MKEENDEVRVKLHITAQNDPTVRNLWMCLNYNQRPTIGHIIEYIKKYYSDYFGKNTEIECQKKLGYESEDQAKLASQIKLYLEDYWLPPYENSRLIRENDCIKVNVKLDDHNEKDHYSSERTKTKNDNLFSYYNGNDSNKLQQKNTMYSVSKGNESETMNCDFYNYNLTHGTCLDCCGKGCQQTCGWNFMELNERKQQQTQKLNNLNKATDLNNNKKVKANDGLEKNQLKSQSNEELKKNMNKQNAGKISKIEINCHKKFAIGSYVHLLNEPDRKDEKKKSNIEEDEESDGLSEEQVIDDYYKSLQHNKPLKNKPKQGNKQENKQQQTIESSTKSSSADTKSKQQQQHQPNHKKQENKQVTSESVDLDKIASKLNSSGKLKWKNSTKSTVATNKHIIFTSSDSSSESDSDEEKQSNDNVENKQKMEHKKSEESAKPKEQTKYYLPSKEEQLNAVSSQRSFVIENPKTLAQFKRIFNETKLHAPKAEEFSDIKSEGVSKENENKFIEATKENKEIILEEADKNNKNESLDESTRSSMSTSSSDLSLNNIENKSSKKKNRRRSRSPRIDFNSLQPLIGAPRVDDRIAFQILEISSNFTPEISGYKNGTVIEFDILTNEVTLKLHSKYNSVLKKPSKFSVVLEDDEDELKNDGSSESSVSSNGDKSRKYEDEILKVDYRNLINVKLMPKDIRSRSPLQQLQQQATN